MNIRCVTCGAQLVSVANANTIGGCCPVCGGAEIAFSRNEFEARADERKVMAESLTTRDGFIGVGTQCQFCERQLYTHNKLDNPYGVVCFDPDACPIQKAGGL